jgi:hypothetical protein
MHSVGAVGHITAGARLRQSALSGQTSSSWISTGSDGQAGWFIEGNGRSVRNTYGKNGIGVYFLGNNN